MEILHIIRLLQCLPQPLVASSKLHSLSLINSKMHYKKYVMEVESTHMEEIPRYMETIADDRNISQ